MRTGILCKPWSRTRRLHQGADPQVWGELLSPRGQCLREASPACSRHLRADLTEVSDGSDCARPPACAVSATDRGYSRAFVWTLRRVLFPEGGNQDEQTPLLRPHPRLSEPEAAALSRMGVRGRKGSSSGSIPSRPAQHSHRQGRGHHIWLSHAPGAAPRLPRQGWGVGKQHTCPRHPTAILAARARRP